MSNNTKIWTQVSTAISQNGLDEVSAVSTEMMANRSRSDTFLLQTRTENTLKEVADLELEYAKMEAQLKNGDPSIVELELNNQKALHSIHVSRNLLCKPWDYIAKAHPPFVQAYNMHVQQKLDHFTQHAYQELALEFGLSQGLSLNAIIGMAKDKI